MGPLLRMQTRLHFEDLPENEQVQYLQKIALRAENPSGHNYCHKKGPPDFYVEWVFILRWSRFVQNYA